MKGEGEQTLILYEQTLQWAFLYQRKTWFTNMVSGEKRKHEEERDSMQNSCDS